MIGEWLPVKVSYSLFPFGDGLFSKTRNLHPTVSYTVTLSSVVKTLKKIGLTMK